MEKYNLLTIDIEVEKEPELEIEIDYTPGGGGGELPYYTGSYEVKPRIVEQVLPTAKKSMAKDLTVLEIPYEEVHNVTGTTVTIGGE